MTRPQARPVGRPMLCPEATLRRILEYRQDAWTYRQICDIFNAEGLPTPSGKTTWYPSYPWRLMGTAAAASTQAHGRRP